MLENDFLLAVAKRAAAIDPDEAREDLSKLLEIDDRRPIENAQHPRLW